MRVKLVLPETVQDIINERGISIETAAYEIGLGGQTLRKYLRGQHIWIQPDTINKMVTWAGITDVRKVWTIESGEEVAS